MLPQVLREDHIRIFKFWFNGGLQDGLHFRNELFYRCKTVDIFQRARLYQLATRLTEHHAYVLVTVTPDHCSLWISLRNQKLAASHFRQHLSLPTVESFFTTS